MTRGKSICEYLKSIRKQIAKANGIDYSPIQCTHKGDCAGTCPACEQEREYLEHQLSTKQKMGAPIKIIGLSMALASGGACSSDPSSPSNPSEVNPNLGDTVLLTEELRPSCSDSSATDNGDTSHQEETDLSIYPADSSRQRPIAGRIVRIPKSTDKEGGSPTKKSSSQPTKKALKSTQPDDDVEATPGLILDIPPYFPGGKDSLNAFLKKNLHYPQSAIKDNIEGTVIVQFVVNPDGSISDAEVIHSIDPRLDEEALRVVQLMPKWEPASRNRDGRFNLPIRFNLQYSTTTDSVEVVKESE